MAYGDFYDGYPFDYPHWQCVPMGTAIIRTYTPDGFVIAADGRSCTDEDFSVISDTTQKIFRIEDRAGILACSMAGTTGLTAKGSDEIILDLYEEAIKIAGGLATRQSTNLYGYAVHLSKLLNHALESVKSSKALPLYPIGGTQQDSETGQTILRIFLDGYYHGKPSRASIRLSHTDQKLDDARIYKFECPVPVMSMAAHGSQIIAKSVFDPDTTDERFAAYRVRDPTNIGSVVLRSKNFILAHSDPEAMLIGENMVRCVGGHIHIAAVTPREGFQWLPGHEPVVLLKIQEHDGEGR